MSDIIEFIAAHMLRRIQQAGTAEHYESVVRGILADTYAPAGIEIWLSTANTAFGSRSARQAIADGDVDLVIRRAEYIAGGSW